jgi:hypothetical protein
MSRPQHPRRPHRRSNDPSRAQHSGAVPDAGAGITPATAPATNGLTANGAAGEETALTLTGARPVSAQHTATLVFRRLGARWPTTSFRVKKVGDDTVNAFIAGLDNDDLSDDPVCTGLRQRPLEGLTVEWSDGPSIDEVNACVGCFLGVEADGHQLVMREGLLTTPSRSAVLVQYLVGYISAHRRLSSSYRRDLRTCARSLRAHGVALLTTEAAGSAGSPGAHRSLEEAAPRAGLSVVESSLLRLPESTWTPWGIHRGPATDLLELLSRRISPEDAGALAGLDQQTRVTLLQLL